MGWTIPYHMPHRTDLIRERVQTERGEVKDLEFARRYLLGGQTIPDDAKPEDYRWEMEALKHCYRGGMRSGVLWVVWERRIIRKADNVVVSTFRIIGCDLLRYYAEGRGMGNWGYKDMDETCGPCETSCPLSYLDMVPVPTGKDGVPYEFAVSFRARVRERANTYRPVLLERVRLRGCKVEWVRIVSLRPLMGRDSTDYLWKVPRRCIVGSYDEKVVANTGPS